MRYEIDQRESEQITILKGILIVLVVFIHSYREQVTFLEGNVVLMPPVWLEWMKYVLSQVVARAAVPAFFMLSSILLYRKEFIWRDNMRKKLGTILAPYIFLNSFWILFFYFAQYFDFTIPYLVTSQSRIQEWGILGWLDAYLGNFMDDYPVLYPTWFLRDLFILNLFAPLIRNCVDRFPRLVLSVLIGIWLLPIQIPCIGGEDLSGQSFVFFILGYYVVRYDLHMKSCDRWNGGLLALLYAFLVFVTALSRNAPWGYSLQHFTILIGILCFVKLSRIIEEGVFRRQFLWFSGHSFFIFAFHEMGLTIVTKLLTHGVEQTWLVQLLEYVGLPLLMILLCVLASMTVRRFWPGFYNVITGNHR